LSLKDEAPPPGRRPPWIGLLIPAVIAVVVLVGLGTWQIQRKAWKEALIAALTQQLAAPPIALPPAATWPSLDPAKLQYHRVRFSAKFDHNEEALVYAVPSAFRPDVSGAGYWVLTPARLADGSKVLVNRGFVPEGWQDPQTRPAGQIAGTIEITGALRWPDPSHWFTPRDEPPHNLWFTADPAAIAAAKGLGAVAPFYVEQESPVPPGGLPQPGKLVVMLPDNHLQYALTWYGLAIVLVIMFVAWAFGSGRDDLPGSEGAQPRPRPSRSL
jgi:surfeit locus 1 family protein